LTTQACNEKMSSICCACLAIYKST